MRLLVAMRLARRWVRWRKSSVCIVSQFDVLLSARVWSFETGGRKLPTLSGSVRSMSLTRPPLRLLRSSVSRQPRC